MRFNDLLRTVLANGGEGLASAVTRWRQCIDLLAQYDVSGAHSAQQLNDADSAAIFAVLDELRMRLGAEQRVASIVELGARLRSARLVRFLGDDHPAVVSAVMAQARLTDADWAALIPGLGPLARSILRRRADLGTLARTALARFGTTDLGLPHAPTQMSGANPASPAGLRAANDSTPDEPVPPRAGEAARKGTPTPSEPSEIRRIVERIERFTASRELESTSTRAARTPERSSEPAHGPASGPSSGPALELALDQVADASDDPIAAFGFVTDSAGRFVEAIDAPRAAVIGLTVGQAGIDGLSGGDGQVLGAFRRRAAFRDARFSIAVGLLAGEWRLSGEPIFDAASGHFRGFTGTARREMPHEQLVKSAAPLPEWGGLSATGARQLIHELRTPLSAIYAYAEMIEAQLVGPVSSEYRELARQILADARELVATFDDLDLAGRIARDEGMRQPHMIDMLALVRQVAQRFFAAVDHRLMIEANGALPLVWADREQMERMITHLLRGGYAALAPGEPLILRLRHLPVTGRLSLVMQRPIVLRGLSEASLLDHASTIDQALANAPPLGLPFTLRLVRGIATRMGGQFLFSGDSFELVLPAAGEADSEQESGK